MEPEVPNMVLDQLATLNPAFDLGQALAGLIVGLILGFVGGKKKRHNDDRKTPPPP